MYQKAKGFSRKKDFISVC